MDAGLTKQEIRILSKQLGLPNWDKPSFACLASRFPYGIQITGELLDRVADGEKFLREQGFRQFRVRHPAPIVRMELDEGGMQRLQDKNLRHNIIRMFKNLGYVYITVDIQGYRTGSLNEGLMKNLHE